MIVQQLSSTVGGTAVALGTRTLTAPSGAAPRVSYRDVRYLRLATGSLAEELALVANSTTLNGSFTHLDFDAVAMDEPTLRATKTSLGGGTIAIELGAPRHVQSIRIAAAKVPAGNYTLELYRMDGEAISGEPTATATNADNLLQVAINFVGDTILAEEAEFMLPVPPPVFAFDFTDTRFALRLKEPDGDYVSSLTPAHVEQINVRSFASTPRLSVAFPEDPSAPVGDPLAALPFWQAAGEIGGAVPATAGEFTAGTALAEALQRSAARLADAVRATATPESPVAALPATIDVALVIQSDAPCRFVPTAFGVTYRFVNRSFVSGAEKDVLRFTGAGGEPRTATVRLPGAAQITSATIRATQSLRTEQPPAGAAAAASAPPVSRAGVRISGDRHAAQALQLDAAIEATGLLVGVLPITSDARLRAELVEDAAGAPAGRVLAVGTLSDGRAGQPSWGTLGLSDPVIVTTAQHWLRLWAEAGEAVWLSAPGSGPALVLTKDPSTGADATLASLTDRDLIAHVLTARGSTDTGAATSLRIGSTTVTATVLEDGKLEYDIAAALATALAGEPAGTAVEVALEFRAVTSGMVTLYPPRVEFDGIPI